MASTGTDRSTRTFFGHPPVLANLFGVELWERFSFYGMQGILLIYLYYPADRGGLGINLGALAGPLLTGLLQKNTGFHYGFGLAAAGMFLGLVQYGAGRRRLTGAAREVPNPMPPEVLQRVALGTGAGLVVVVVILVSGVLPASRYATAVAIISAVAAVVYFAVILRSSQLSDIERRRVLAFIPLFIASAAFWSLYQQQFTVVTIYSDQRLDRNILGWEMPVSFVQSINPVMIIILSGVFAALWTKLGPRQPSTPVKFSAGLAIMGIAFLLFLTMAGGGPNSAPLLGLAGILLVFTIAELLLSPVGLSLSTKLAPAAFRTQMVALFFLSVALGTAMSGVLAKLYSTEHETAYFGIIGAVALALGGLLALAVRPIRNLMSGVH